MAGIEDRTRRLSNAVAGEARFRFAIELLARGRDLEAQDVIFDAGRVPVSRLDPEMSDAFEDLRSLMREFDASTRWAFGCLLVLEVIRDLYSGVEERAEVGDLPVFSIPQILEMVGQMASVFEGRLKALDRAFSELGRERLGLEPETLQAVQPEWVRAGFEHHRAAIEAAEMAQADLESARKTLLTGWGPEGFGAVLRPGEG